MKINKKGISVLLSGMLLSGMLVGCGNNKDKSINETNTKIEEQKFNKEVVADNEYFKMTVINKDMDEYSSFVRMQVLVENKTDKDIIVYLENICVDGVMNDPAWCVNINANNKAYSYIEWLIDYDNNPNVKTVEDLKNIEGEVYVTDSNYNELFRTDINMLMAKDTVKTEAKVTEDKEDKEVKTAKEVTKDKEEEKSSSQDNNSTKKKPVTKEESKEKPIYDEYGYDQYGNYNPNKDLHNDREWNNDDHKRWEEAHGEDCSICGGHVGGKEMCECDGTIHHRTCHIDAYTCPSCNRYGLKHNPDIYGCPYCGYPNEVEEYDSEEPIQEADDYYE